MALKSQIAWREFPHEAWIEEITRYRDEDLEYEEEAYQDLIKKRILTSLALRYWEALISCAESSGLPSRKRKEMIEKTIQRILGRDRSQGARWAGKKICPDPSTFFGTLVIVLRREIEEVGFPNRQESVWSAVSRTIWLIRSEDCGKDWCPGLSRQEFAYVFWLVRHPHAEVLLGHKGSSSEEKIYNDTLDRVRSLNPSWVIEGVVNVETAFLRWTRPYLLLIVGLIKGWEFLDVEAAGNVRGSAAADR